MATVADEIRRVLRQELDADASDVERVSADGRIAGAVIAERFTGLEQVERQRLVWRTLREHLAEDFLLNVGLLMTMTPAEAAAVRHG